MLTLRVAYSPKSCSESKKQLKIVQVAKKVPSRICLGLELNLTETLFFFPLSFTLSVSNIHNPNSTPRLPAPPYLRSHTSRETQSLVSLDARKFSSKAVQLFSPKRVNLLICWLSMALRWAQPRGPQPGGITITPIAGCA